MNATSIDEATSLCGYSLKTILIVSLAAVIGIIAIKKYFNGGSFNTPNINLKGKNAVVTGGNSGIGAQTVKELARLGCSVVIGARDKVTAESLIKSIRKADPSAKVQFISLDLSSLQSVKEFANNIQFETIDYLVNNAGVMAIPKRRLSKEGYEMQWAVNHLGHFYLTYLLWKKILKSNFFRIINVSSLAHINYQGGFGGHIDVDWQNINFQKDYDPSLSYCRSKLYNVFFTKALAKKIDAKRGLTASLHPGVVRTQLLRQIKNQGIFGKIFNIVLLVFYPLYWLFTKDCRQGAQTTLYTLFADDVENGAYYADCAKSTQNKNISEESWNKLWELSQKNASIRFNI